MSVTVGTRGEFSPEASVRSTGERIEEAPPGAQRAVDGAARRGARGGRRTQFPGQDPAFCRRMLDVRYGVYPEELVSGFGSDAVERSQASRLLRRDLGELRLVGVQRSQRWGGLTGPDREGLVGRAEAPSGARRRWGAAGGPTSPNPVSEIDPQLWVGRRGSLLVLEVLEQDATILRVLEPCVGPAEYRGKLDSKWRTGRCTAEACRAKARRATTLCRTGASASAGYGSRRPARGWSSSPAPASGGSRTFRSARERYLRALQIRS